MADNTKQFKYIVMIKEGLGWLFVDQLEVFIAGDLLWYPVEGNNKICQAPDVLAAFGRPKGHRRSYIQFKEGGIAPQVVFEILSHNNTLKEMARKFQFYERYGVEEYYVYDPDTFKLNGWWRQRGALVEIEAMHGWASPRLGIRFEIEEEGLKLYRPDGQRFWSMRRWHVCKTKNVSGPMRNVRAPMRKSGADAERQTKRAHRPTRSGSREAGRPVAGIRCKAGRLIGD